MAKNCKPNIIVPDKYSVVVVRNLQERDNIPCKLRQDGMVSRALGVIKPCVI